MLVCVWVVILSPTVRSHWSSLPCFEMLSWLCGFLGELRSSILRDVSWPIVVQCCGLSKVYGGEGCSLQGLWLALLESAKNQFLGVYPLELYMPQHVWYGMTCLLIRDILGSSVSQRMVRGTSWLPDKPTLFERTSVVSFSNMSSLCVSFCNNLQNLS
jgi:hypothetical protein